MASNEKSRISANSEGWSSISLVISSARNTSGEDGVGGGGGDVLFAGAAFGEEESNSAIRDVLSAFVAMEISTLTCEFVRADGIFATGQVRLLWPGL